MPFLHRTPSPLFVAELLDIILGCLAEPSNYEPSHYDYASGTSIQIRTPDPDGRRALAVLARTCRGFSEPSLNYLWRRLNSLEPLIRCFSPKAAVSSARLGLPPPSPADWVIINRYSHRIRELEVQDDRSCIFLERTNFESHLLPNLKTLKWRTRANLYPFGIAYIQPLLVPGLIVLDAAVAEHDKALVSFLKTCPSRCPGLTTIGFYIYTRGRESQEMIDTFSRALCSFKNLKCLFLNAPVNNTALQKLLISSDLQELTFHLRENSLPPGFSITIGPFLGGLAPSPNRSPLRSLRLGSAHISHVRDWRLFVLSFNTFRPLTFLTNLRELIIQLENPIALSDEELVDLAHNWPLLQAIELCYDRWYWLRAKYITFKGLLSLVTICPKLRAVGLTLDGRNVPSEVPVELGGNSVTTLRFPNSPIDSPRLVAKFLLTYFPSVTSTSISGKNKWGVGLGGAVDRRSEKWAEVGRYLADASKLDSIEVGGDDG